jgi:hypothetical protein
MRRVAICALVVGTAGAVAVTGAARAQAVRACSLSLLTLRRGPLVSEKTGGQATVPLVLTDRASRACFLVGYPAVAFFDRRGRRIPFNFSHRGDQMVTGARPRPVTLRRGASAYFGLNETDCQVYTTLVARVVRVALPGSRQADSLGLRRYPILNYCGPAYLARITVSPFERRASGWGCDSQGSCERPFLMHPLQQRTFSTASTGDPITCRSGRYALTVTVPLRHKAIFRQKIVTTTRRLAMNVGWNTHHDVWALCRWR